MAREFPFNFIPHRHETKINHFQPQTLLIHPSSLSTRPREFSLLSWRKHLTGNIREAFCDSGPASLPPLSIGMTVQGMGEVVWRRRGVQWVGNDSLPRAPETAFSFCRRHRSVSRRFHGLFQERCPLATPADKGGKKKNRREKRSKRNGTTNGGASSNHRITYLGRGEFLRVWDEGQGTKKGKLYVKRDRFIDGGELSMIVICFVFFFFFFRFGKIYEKIFFFRFE